MLSLFLLIKAYQMKTLKSKMKFKVKFNQGIPVFLLMPIALKKVPKLTKHVPDQMGHA